MTNNQAEALHSIVVYADENQVVCIHCPCSWGYEFDFEVGLTEIDNKAQEHLREATS